jgi:hypothetical protein
MWTKILVSFFVLSAPLTVFADANCTSRSTCQSAINSALDGDTITLTQNDSSWNSTLTISKGVHFKGSSGSISISGSASPLVTITRDATHSIEVSDLTMSGVSIDIDGAGKPPLIHDCTFTTSGSGPVIYFRSNGGVFYSNTITITSAYIGVEAIKHKDTGSLSEWETASTMGDDDTTGENNTYIEGNTFNDFVTQAVDVDDGARVVYRYNTFENSGIASHGFCSSAVGNRHWEFINNDFSYTEYETQRGNVANGWIKMRGGTGIVTGNNFDTISGYWGSKGDLDLAVWAIGSNENCGQYPSGCCSSYPCTRQVSHSHTGSDYEIDPVYYWSNTGLGLSTDGNGSSCGGLSIGDVLSSGTNYTNSSKSGYTQYTCPHPLAGSGTCDSETVGASGYEITGDFEDPPQASGITFSGVTIGQ